MAMAMKISKFKKYIVLRAAKSAYYGNNKTML